MLQLVMDDVDADDDDDDDDDEDDADALQHRRHGNVVASSMRPR